MYNLDKCRELYHGIRVLVIMKDNIPEENSGSYVGWYIIHNSRADQFLLARQNLSNKTEKKFTDHKELKVSEISQIVCLETDYDNGFVYDCTHDDDWYAQYDNEDEYEAEYYESKLRDEDNCKML